jgi:hypothetical protein
MVKNVKLKVMSDYKKLISVVLGISLVGLVCMYFGVLVMSVFGGYEGLFGAGVFAGVFGFVSGKLSEVIYGDK